VSSQLPPICRARSTRREVEDCWPYVRGRKIQAATEICLERERDGCLSDKIMTGARGGREQQMEENMISTPSSNMGRRGIHIFRVITGCPPHGVLPTFVCTQGAGEGARLHRVPVTKKVQDLAPFTHGPHVFRMRSRCGRTTRYMERIL